MKDRRRRTVRWLAILSALFFVWIPGEGMGQELRVMSFNIRYGTAEDGPNAWPLRRNLVTSVVDGFRPDVLGLQEALSFQLEELSDSLPEMARLGVGRDDGVAQGEFSAILYREDRLDLLEGGTFWFSDTPEVPGSMSWGNEIPRICTWGRFRDRNNGQIFTLFNLHWDHRSQPSRERGAELLLSRIQEGNPGPAGGGIQGQSPSEVRVLVTGDFNAGEENPAFLALVSPGESSLRDTYRSLHPQAAEVGTFHGFNGGTEGEKIDAVLAGPGWTILDARIHHTQARGRYPSDHYPVSAVVAWNPTIDDGRRNDGPREEGGASGHRPGLH